MRRSTRCTAIALACVVLAAGCGLGANNLAGYEGLNWQLQRYYLDRATEERGMCTKPRIRTITASEVVEETDEELVLRVRYTYEDESAPEFETPLVMVQPQRCEGFATRTFKLAKIGDGSVEVTSMSGEKRSGEQNFDVGPRDP